MPPTIETEPQARGLEEELHELEQDESALERRTDSLALTNVLSLLFAFLALAISLVAVLVAVLAGDDNGNDGAQLRGRSASSGPAMAGGMMGSRAAGNSAPAGVRTVQVQLGEMWVKPQYTSVQAGKVTFVARNTGQAEHELMVERTPIKFDSPGRPTEDAAVGMIEDMEPGMSGRMTLKLTPGTYNLFCNVPGHYAAGQHTRFTVTEG
jgi:uncharacterized cupredoxin-like copper-binding protein